MDCGGHSCSEQGQRRRRTTQSETLRVDRSQRVPWRAIPYMDMDSGDEVSWFEGNDSIVPLARP